MLPIDGLLRRNEEYTKKQKADEELAFLLRKFPISEAKKTSFFERIVGRR